VSPGEASPRNRGPIERRARLRELAALFLKLGTIAFGGPAGHIAVMEDEVVRRRGWVSRERFLDMLGAANLIPGPNSTEMAIHVGYQRAGFAGLLVAGSCFILPATFIVGFLAWAYVRYGSPPAAAGLFYGVKPIVIAIVIQAIWRLGRSAIKSRLLAGTALAAAAAVLVGVNELIVLFGAGALAVIFGGLVSRNGSNQEGGRAATAPPALFPHGLGAATVVAASPVALGPLFVVFLKIGSVLFGSGYVLLAFLRADLVTRTHWLTEPQLLDAVAVGQVTPGPVFTTATFIGYLLAGPRGAAVATLGIFLPAFVFVAISGPLLPRLRQSRLAGSFLDGLNVASLALMVVVCWQLGRAAVTDWWTAALAVVSTVFLLTSHVSPTWLVVGGALIGVLLAIPGAA
jgi:chromate transporter